MYLNELAQPATAKTDFARDRWGRPLIEPPDGGKPAAYTRPSTLAKSLSDPSALTAWIKRQTVYGLSRREDLVALAATVTDPAGDPGRKVLTDVSERAMEAAESSAKADIGTAIHACVEQRLLGLPTGHYPGPIRAKADLVVQLLDHAGLTPVATELRLVNDRLKVAGTTDLLLQGSRGGRFIGDLKTSGVNAPKYAGVEWAIQLACYACGATPYDPLAGGGREPWPDDQPPDTATALIVHVPQTDHPPVLWRVDLAAGLAAAQLALQVRDTRKHKPLTAVPIPTTEKGTT